MERGEGVYRGAESRAVAEERRDVPEDDSGLRKVGNVAHEPSQ